MLQLGKFKRKTHNFVHILKAPLAIYYCASFEKTMKNEPIFASVSVNTSFVIYLDSREGDSRGGVGADHQRHDGGAQRTEHVGQLQGQMIQ